MSTPTVTPPSTPAWTPPEPYTPDETKLNLMWDAAGRGDWITVSLYINDLEIGWLGVEMKRLATLGEHYGKLEKGADSLMAVLNAHTKKGKLEVSKVMLDFIDTGVELLTKAGKTPSPEIMDIITKIKSGEEITQEEAQKFYAWVADAKLVVIPAEYSSEALAAQAKSARERYDKYVAEGKNRLSTYSVN